MLDPVAEPLTADIALIPWCAVQLKLCTCSLFFCLFTIVCYCWLEMEAIQAETAGKGAFVVSAR